MGEFLFERGESAEASEAGLGEAAERARVSGAVRLRVPERQQVEMRFASLDQLLPADHQARVVWQLVSKLDLARWLTRIKAVEGGVGRDATAPQLLVALWVYATLEGIGSAREVERLCQLHLAFQWLCGGVSVNHHLLSDCRSKYPQEWDELLTQIVATLRDQGLVTMNRVAQDGMRVRASAGKSSFRRRETLARHLQEAREQVAELRRLAEESPSELPQRAQAARERAAAERAARLEAALEECAQLQQQREERENKSGAKGSEARASTTDGEARVMQFSDHGYRPGYNVQFCTDTASGLIVGVDVTSQGSDAQQLVPMLDQLQQRYGQLPAEALVDGGFASQEAIEEAHQRGCLVFAPLKQEQRQRQAGRDPYQPKPGDSPGVAAWRQRMGQPASQELYRLRPQTAEWVNAQARNRGLQQMSLRGRVKCRILATLQAITHNLWHARGQFA